MKRKIGELWKEKNLWFVQFPKGIMTFKTKKVAMLWVNNLRKEYK